jgi:hypothetical protein
MQGLLEFIWMEGCSGQSSNPGLALVILVLTTGENVMPFFVHGMSYRPTN